LSRSSPRWLPGWHGGCNEPFTNAATNAAKKEKIE
jgi:hypothetical protein